MAIGTRAQSGRGRRLGFLFSTLAALGSLTSIPACQSPGRATSESRPEALPRELTNRRQEGEREVVPESTNRSGSDAGTPLVVGTSAEGRTIRAWSFGDAHGGVFIFGGIHGDETASAFVVEQLVAMLRSGGRTPQQDFRADAAGAGLVHSGAPAAAKTGTWDGILILPAANPDGLSHGTRGNSHGVDLNRNFPASNFRVFGARHGAAAASEPETCAIIELVRQYRPRLIVSVHCIHGRRECNNFDGPARAAAEMLSRFNRYPVQASIGYRTPGSFGSWAGVDLGIAVVTVELPRGERAEVSWAENREGLLAVLQARGTMAEGLN